MKKIMVILGLMTAVAFYACQKNASNAAETQYLNLGFEDYSANGAPKIWWVGGKGYKGSADRSVFFSGKASLLLEKIADLGEEVPIRKDDGSASYMFPVDVAKGRAMRFSAFIKTEKVEAGFAGIWCHLAGPENKDLGLVNMQDRGPRGTSGWTEYVLELDIPQETTFILFGTILTGSGKAWFDDLKIELDGIRYAQTRPEPILPKRAELRWVRKQAVPIATVDPTQDHQDLMPLIDMIGDRSIVALGEATHGTSEFFKIKHRIVRFLAEEMGFSVFVIEANMPEAREVNRYVLTGEGDPRNALAGLHFWTVNTQEVLDMIEWMRDFNLSGGGRMEFMGLDMQYPEVAMDQVEEFVKILDPDYLPELQEQYRIVRDIWASYSESWDASGIDFGKWQTAAAAVYAHMKDREQVYSESTGALETAWTIQDAQIVVQAAEAELSGGRTRDKSMAENLGWIRNVWPAGTKIVIWAHNGHVARGLNMGYFLDQSYGDEYMVFGFAFHRGEYTAKGNRGLNVYSAYPSYPGSVGWLLKESDIPQFILDLRQARQGEKGSRWLFQKMPIRSIGSSAMDSAFTSLNVRRLFDVLIFFENTTASHCFRVTQKK